MSFNEHTEKFADLDVLPWRPGQAIERPLDSAIRIDLGDDHWSTTELLSDRFSAFVEQAGAASTKALVFGMYNMEQNTGGLVSVIAALIANKDKLPALRHLFIADIIQEENEISWIEQGDYAPLLEAYPNLETLRIRGGSGLRLGTKDHERLTKLVVETGGLSGQVVRDISGSTFPMLKHLELWLGTDEYGGNSTVGDLAGILDARSCPNITYLGLRNAESADSLAAALVAAPIMGKVEILDLSKGTLGDEGVRALMQLPRLGELARVDVHHNFISADVGKEFEMACNVVGLGEKGEEDQYDGETHRYVAVSE